MTAGGGGSSTVSSMKKAAGEGLEGRRCHGDEGRLDPTCDEKDPRLELT